MAAGWSQSDHPIVWYLSAPENIIGQHRTIEQICRWLAAPQTFSATITLMLAAVAGRLLQMERIHPSIYRIKGRQQTNFSCQSNQHISIQLLDNYFLYGFFQQDRSDNSIKLRFIERVDTLTNQPTHNNTSLSL